MALFNKKTCSYFVVIAFSGIILLYYGLALPTWPSKTRLCRDLESYITRSECMRLEDRYEIVEQAFPIGITSEADVRKTLGEYFHAEYETTYGYLEVYYLSKKPINYLIRYFKSFSFAYDRNGILISIRGDDF